MRPGGTESSIQPGLPDEPGKQWRRKVGSEQPGQQLPPRHSLRPESELHLRRGPEAGNTAHGAATESRKRPAWWYGGHHLSARWRSECRIPGGGPGLSAIDEPGERGCCGSERFSHNPDPQKQCFGSALVLRRIRILHLPQQGSELCKLQNIPY